MALLVEAHASTWFSIEGLKLVVKYAQGVPAGTSLADLVFCAGCLRITTLFTAELAKENLLFQGNCVQTQLDDYCSHIDRKRA